jgi:hypothetical protein
MLRTQYSPGKMPVKTPGEATNAKSQRNPASMLPRVSLGGAASQGGQSLGDRLSRRPRQPKRDTTVACCPPGQFRPWEDLSGPVNIKYRKQFGDVLLPATRSAHGGLPGRPISPSRPFICRQGGVLDLKFLLLRASSGLKKKISYDGS